MRHAEEHWLRIQAEAAVARAITTPDPTVEDEVRHLTEMAERPCYGIDPTVTLRHYRDVAIMDAAKAIEKAELLHREIVRRGETV
ncbi:MAG: hypothetical protein JNJ45_05395 [Chthonomonas sp.]|nr:hypothetical protein [Chthonomonas sp.]